MIVIPPKRKFTDQRGCPGELVLLRGTKSAQIWRDLECKQPAGVAIPNSTGLIVCVEKTFKQFTYVLWSNPCIAGWISDGLLRRI